MADWGVFILVVAMVMSSVVKSQAEEPGKNVTCTADLADVRHNATVTCHFTDGVINLAPVSLSVEFYSEAKNSSVPATIPAYLPSSSSSSSSSVFLAGCVWAVGLKQCQKLSARYAFFPSDASRNMTLKIYDVTADDAGYYVCRQTSPVATPRSVPCVLHVRDDPAVLPTESSTGRPVDADRGDSDVSGTTTDGSGTLAPGEGDSSDAAVEAKSDGMLKILLPAVLGGTVLVIGILTAVCLCWRRRRRLQKETGKPAGDEEEMQPAISETIPSPSENDPLTPSPPNPPRNSPDPSSEHHQPSDTEDAAEPLQEEDGSDTKERNPLVDRDNFNMELKTTAAVMQVPIQRKMSTGDYPFPQ